MQQQQILLAIKHYYNVYNFIAKERKTSSNHERLYMTFYCLKGLIKKTSRLYKL